MGSQRVGHDFHFHMVILYLIFRGITVFYTVAIPFCISNNAQGLQFQSLHILVNTCYFLFFFLDSSHPDDCKVVSHCNFDLHVSKISNAKHFFICLLATCVYSLEKYLYKFFVQVSCRQHMIGSCVFLHSFNLCHLIGGFNPFTFTIITDESESVSFLVMSNFL